MWLAGGAGAGAAALVTDPQLLERLPPAEECGERLGKHVEQLRVRADGAQDVRQGRRHHARTHPRCMPGSRRSVETFYKGKFSGMRLSSATVVVVCGVACAAGDCFIAPANDPIC